MISEYSFGKLVFEGKPYTRDLIILHSQLGTRVLSNWWRKEGHYLQVEDLKEVWDFSPEYLVVGTGAYGVMKVDPRVIDEASSKGIKLESYPTSQAVERFNELYSQGKKVAGAFHLTC